MNLFFTKIKKVNHSLFFLGLLLLMMEIVKQLYLYFIYFNRHYDVWYVPFQLCSIPMYLCLLRYICVIYPPTSSWLRIIDTFLLDYTMLGGIAALIVHDGFTYPRHFLLTCHGYLWHILLIFISLNIWKHHLADLSIRGFFRTLWIFVPLVTIAEIFNILLHPYGDCDMFYISPYHLSSQPVFHSIDSYLGRTTGIILYILAMIIGALLIHGIYSIIARFQNASHDYKRNR